MDQEWMKLQELSNRLNNVCKPAWENILIKTGSSYVNADEAVRKLLPKGYDTEPGWAWTALQTCSAKGAKTNPATTPRVPGSIKRASKRFWPSRKLARTVAARRWMP